jgi:Peptidase A4 family
MKGKIMPTEKPEIRVPYKLVPTNLAGAFLTPAPPADFDPNTASPAALIKHGFLWRRPGPGDAPVLRTAWERAFSRRWRAEDRLIPELEPQVGKTHHLRSARRADEGTFTNPEWAGSVVSGFWTGAVGSWVIPAVTEPLQPQGTEGGWNSASWVGIDGAFGSDSVLQAGVEQWVDGDGSAHYGAWFEWFAAPQSDSPPYVYQTNIPNFTVRPGQTVYCSVLYVSNDTAGQVTFANETTGQHFSITLAPPPGATLSGLTAEWIMEAPDGGEPIASLPIFTPVVFTSATCCGPFNTTGSAEYGIIFNIVGFGTTLTSVTQGPDTVTIDYIGPLPAGPVCGLSPGGQAVWQYDGSGTSWTQIGGPAGQIYGGGYGLVATNPTTGDLWRYLGTPQEWEQIGGPGTSFAVTTDTVFGLSPDGQAVWQYDGSGTSWTQIGGPAGQIVAVPAG